MDAPPALGPPLVLVVEDDEGVRDVLQALLESAGYTAEAVPTGAAALSRIDAGGVDLVLLDLMLPDMSGREICAHVRARETSVYLPIIMLTALTREADRHAGFAAGADDYVTKPFEIENLLDRVGVWVRTRRRLVEQQHQLTRQASLLNLASDGIFVRDLDSRITYWNAGAARLYGWTASEALGRFSYELLQTEFPEPRAAIEAVVFRDGHWQGEIVQRRRDGARMTVASRWALQRDEVGRPVAILVLNSDITERKRLEVERAERARLEGVLLATRTMEHELNNKLTPTAGYAALLAQDPALPDHLRSAASRTLTGAQEAARIVQQLQQLTDVPIKRWGGNMTPTIDMSPGPS